MGERVVVRQDRNFITRISAGNPHEPESGILEEVDHIHELTPYGMLLASLGSCTGIVIHTFAQYHGIDLDEVTFHLEYDRIFAEDCVDCQDIETYKERIEEQISLSGHLTEGERHKLFAVSKHCPIHKILIDGMELNSYLAAESDSNDQRP